MDHTQLIQAQQQREAEAIQTGIENYRKRVLKTVEAGGFDKHEQVRELARGAIPIVAAGIRKWLEEQSTQKGRKPSGYEAINLLDADAVAAAALTAIFRAQTDGGATAQITLQIGRFIEAQLEAQAVVEKDPKAVKKYQKLAEGVTSEGRLKARWARLINENEAALQWSDKTRSLVGQTALNVVLVELEELFYRDTIMTPEGKRLGVILLTPAGEQAVIAMEDEAALRFLPFRPMVTQPRPWERLNTGGYYDLRLSRLVPMVRLRDKEGRKRVRQAIKDGSMAPVINSLNAMQNTRFAIDKRVLPWVEWALEAGVRTAKSFPTYDIPAKPEPIKKDEWAKLDPDVAKALGRRRSSLKKNISSLNNLLDTFAKDMAEVRSLMQHPAFYLPHSTDFRARAYAVPFFNHQRADHLKGLFRFAEGKPIGESGGRWLMIHLATCGDFPNLLPNATSAKMSKATYDERVEWVKQNHDQIIACAENPADHVDFWKDADSSFCFLQACFEYAEWVATDFSPFYASCIAGAADGSCSGLQHYSCITRSREEAHLVNLTDRDTVGDIYQTVADKAIPLLKAIIAKDLSVDPALISHLPEAEQKKALKEAERDMLMQDAARLVLAQPFGRSELKRNVMTYFYGSGRFGMRDQQMVDLMNPITDKVTLGEQESHPYEMLTRRKNKETGEETERMDGGYTCATVMANAAYDAVVAAAPEADAAAQWVQQLAAKLAHESLSMTWTTPAGFPVTMRYVEYEHKEVNLWLYDRAIKVPSGTDKVDASGNILSRVRVLLRTAATGRVDKNGMRNASSPNMIHSMDSAHLHLSVAAAAAEGIDSFLMIHDSFGTHMGDMERFNEIIREQLVQMYANYCPLEDLRKNALEVLSEEGAEALKPLPKKGDWDIQEVLQAKYAFG